MTTDVPSPTPLPILGGLEEAVQSHLKWFERFICDENELNGSTPRKVAQNAQDAAAELRAALAAKDMMTPRVAGGLASAEPSVAPDKLSAFLDALDEWGCEDNDKRAEEILAFQRGGYDLTAYAEDCE